MASLTATIATKVYTRLTKSADLEAPASTINLQINSNLSSGTGAAQADQQWSDTRTLAASANEELDLYGVLTNQLGDTISFQKIRTIIIEADSANTSAIEIGGAASNAFEGWISAGGKISIRPSGYLLLSANDASGYAVTSTTDKLKIANLSATDSASYNIILIGVNA